MKDFLKRLFRKDEYVEALEEEIAKKDNEITRLETKVRGLEELNKGLASDLTAYKRKWRNATKGNGKKGGKK